MLPAESRTLAITVFEPLLSCLVSQAIETGPDDVSFVVASCLPPAVSV